MEKQAAQRWQPRLRLWIYTRAKQKQFQRTQYSYSHGRDRLARGEKTTSTHTHTLQQSTAGVQTLNCIGRNWPSHVIAPSCANSACELLWSGLHVRKTNITPFICSSVQPQLCSQEGGGMGINWRMRMDIWSTSIHNWHKAWRSHEGRHNYCLFVANPLILLTALSGNLCLGFLPKEEGIDSSDALTIGQIFACNHLG